MRAVCVYVCVYGWGGVHLSSFGLVLDVFCGANLRLDVLKIRQWLADDAQLLGCGRG